ncbi:MAG: hypothetical protein K5931_05085 [Lachnospiraceae bacterium]|nr:hypothetical protein [Lachnospiraceae bacterium]
MKFSLIKNDKSTFWDEVIMGIMILVSLIIGALLILYKPSFWIISQGFSTLIGLLFVIYGIMFIPGLIYRLMTNDRK